MPKEKKIGKDFRMIGHILRGAIVPILLSACSQAEGTRMAEDSVLDIFKSSGPYKSLGLQRQELTDARVLEAMSRVPRHKFVPKAAEALAYEDRALDITEGQTISQPFIVALMTQEARIEPGTKVLEVGTGSGYQSAVLAELGARVFSVEIIPELAHSAADRLRSLKYTQVQIREGDGWLGWKEEAPFDAVLVTAAAPVLPESLLAQVKDGGRIVIPIEDDQGGETLFLLTRKGSSVVSKELGPVKFVPLTGDAAKVREAMRKSDQR